LPDLIHGIKDRYGFVVAPEPTDLVADPSKAGEFKHGRFLATNRTIVVDALTVFNNGVVADTQSSTDDCDVFLGDLFEWATASIPGAALIGPRFYVSQLEMWMEAQLEAYAPIGDKISSLLNGYGISSPRYSVSTIHMSFDQTGKALPQPGVFIIDRRLNVPHDENVWFSQAPLKTVDHVDVLLQEFGKRK
jgi:hypothetical protein